MTNGDDFMPKECFFTKGVGRHPQKLMSFELALRDAGIEKQNLVRVSSIYPTSCKIINKTEGLAKLKPGQITFVVLAEAATDEPNRLICAGHRAGDSEEPRARLHRRASRLRHERKADGRSVRRSRGHHARDDAGHSVRRRQGMGRARTAIQDGRRNRENPRGRSNGRGGQECALDERDFIRCDDSLNQFLHRRAQRAQRARRSSMCPLRPLRLCGKSFVLFFRSGKIDRD